MRFFIVFFVFPFICLGNWGKTGHRVVGEIASNYLTPKASKAVSDLLQGRSLARIGTWADEVRSNPAYDKYNKWHYVNYPLDKKYMEVDHKEENVVKAINLCIEGLKNPNNTTDEKSFYLKYLVHCVADIHQPLHAGLAKDKGGNKIDLNYFNQKTNLHRIWDSNMIDDYGMSYSELAKNLMGRHNKTVIIGTATDWADESHKEASKIYSEVEAGDNLGYLYNYNNFPLVKDKLYKAGIRLASILNEIFSN
ncbi:MAG: S1/P1 nuclease [Flavobacteriaceae bacterium]